MASSTDPNDTRKGEIADNDFRAWFQKNLPVWRQPAEKILQTEPSHVPIMMIYLDSQRDTPAKVIPLVMDGNNADKSRVAWLQRRLANEEFVWAVIVVWEVWMTMHEPGDDPAFAYGSRSLEEHPKRQEGIMFNCLHGHQQLMVVLPIDRATKTLGDPGKYGIVDPFTQGNEGRMILNKPTAH